LPRTPGFFSPPPPGLTGGSFFDFFSGGSVPRAILLTPPFCRNAGEQAKDLIKSQVRGFVRGQDRIDLSMIDANPSLAGNQAFKVVSAFTSAKGEVRLVYSGVDTIIQVDGDLDTAVDMTIRIVNAHVTAADLIL
jgi:serralysin